MIFTTADGSTVTWENKSMTGNPDLLTAVLETVRAGEPVEFDYWGDVPPSVSTEWDAYLTIGFALEELTGERPHVSPVPDNPDGYEEEGPRPEGEG